MLRFLYILLPFVSLVLPATAWFANLVSPKRLHPAVLYIITVILMYVVIVVSARVADAYLYAEMVRLEQVGSRAEADQAAQRWASDTGRTLAPILGLPFAAIWVGLWFSPLYLAEWVIRKIFFKKTVAVESQETPLQTVEPVEPVETNNPFQSPRSE